MPDTNFDEIRRRTCCFTGHRDIPPQERGHIAARLEEVILSLIDRGVRYFGAGGALGFDTMAARTVLHLRETHPQIRLILVLPCPSQTNAWPAEDIAVYEDIKSQADKAVYVSPAYDNGCMHRRNRHLVSHSSICVCYQTRLQGGTAFTVRYAKEQGLEIIYI